VSWLKRLGTVLLLAVIAIAIPQAWRHPQITEKLDETVAELDRTEPGWRLNEIEAAREQVPEDENSARVIVASAKLLPKEWPSQGLAERLAHPDPVEQLSPDDFALLKQELDKARAALEELRKIAGMPRGRHRISYKRNVLNTLLPDQASARGVARVLVLDAMRRGQDRDVSGAMISCRAALNAGRSLGDEFFIISQLIRGSCVISACQAVERTLAQGEPPATELTNFSKLLAAEDAFADLLVAARGERASDQEVFDAVESGDVSIAELADGRLGWHERIFGLIYRDNVRDEHPIMLAMMSRWIAIAQLPSHEQAAAEQQFNQGIRELPETAILTRLLLPALTKVGEASRRKHACIRCTLVALACERYRRDHGGWPESIDKLCPKYLDAVPSDPFDGQPLRYHRLDDGVVIYSVGPDGADNGGKLDREHPNQPGADIGFRLWDVARRRQPPRPKEQQPAVPPGMQQPPPNPR
jgi:hypothetical protein